MQCRTWLGRLGRLGMVTTLALTGVVAVAQDRVSEEGPELSPEAAGEEVKEFEGERDRPRQREGRPGEPIRNRMEVRRFHSPSEYWLGVECLPAQQALRTQLGLPEGQGLVVAEVRPESPAGKAGIKEHDVLLTARVGEREKSLGEIHDLINLLNATKGEKLQITLLSGGEKKTVEVQPEKRPAEDVLIRRMPEEMIMKFMERMPRDGRLQMRVLQPGMMLPPGASVRPQLPDDMTVVITRQGNRPAKIVVKQGEESWNATEETLDELPEEVRRHVRSALGQGPPDAMKFHIADPAQVGEPIEVPLGDRRLEQQMREMGEQLRRLREEMREMREGRPRPRLDRFDPRRDDRPERDRPRGEYRPPEENRDPGPEREPREDHEPRESQPGPDA